MTLERYRDIIPNWDVFRGAIRQPEPVTIRVRSGRIDAAVLIRRLEAQGFRLAPVAGLGEFWRVLEEPYPVSQTLEHWVGFFYVQQSVMGLAALALGVRPGERVLDLCAAPGGKTSHLAELMGDRGTIVAVEPHERRIRKLVGNLYRLGHTGVITVQADGRWVPDGAWFDRVLVDAPCSAEGTLRQRGGTPPAASPGFISYVTDLQERLLRRAVAVTRPGGTVLYATCTFSPEENEAVVDRVLRDAAVVVEPIALDLPHASGVASFGGRSFDPRLAEAWRVYPHHLDSGGLFMVRLRRLDEAQGAPVPEGPGWARPPAVYVEPAGAHDEETARVTERVRRLIEEFAVPADLLAGFRWVVRGKSVWAHTCGDWPLSAWRTSSGWSLVAAGFPAFRRKHGGPTNALLRWLGSAAQRRVLSYDTLDLFRLLSEPPEPLGLPDGPVALAHEGLVLGRGRVVAGLLRQELGKEGVQELRRILPRNGRIS